MNSITEAVCGGDAHIAVGGITERFPGEEQVLYVEMLAEVTMYKK